LENKLYRFFKRVFDIILACLAVLVIWPVLLILAIAIKVQSSGPALFKQKRVGKNGKPFVLYKFRTMRTGINPFGPSPKSGADDRITKVGRFLREYSLDELPQLFNVIKGDMSLVGPRPLYVVQMAEWDQRQKRRLEVMPGLTGLAQVSGRGGLTRERKLELDVQYVERAGILMDIKIIFATAGSVFGRKDIYEDKYSENEDTRGDSQ
jgi:undecaprenyl phosphate N,N'-diacetylbacillosamine 1-phosphate transferase